MNQRGKTQNLILSHFNKYPKLEIRDLFKYVFQSSFGCEHLMTDIDKAIGYIKQEYANVSKEDKPFSDKLDGEYSRVHLSWLNIGLEEETLGRLFYLSAKSEPNGKQELLNKLQIARELINEGSLPFDIKEFEAEVEKWGAMDYPAIHHSDKFRTEYRPSYRVISDKYAFLLPLLARIDEKLSQGPIVIAIEGGSASGKTTLAKTLEEIYDCNVFHVDDFFLRPEQRTPERFAEIGGNMDRERFVEEVLQPLSEKKTVYYRPFNCSTQKLEQAKEVASKALTVIEGAYSMHPDLEKYYDFSVFLDIDPEKQKARILKRNSPQFATRFFEEWIPLENKYFLNMNVKERCDICISV